MSASTLSLVRLGTAGTVESISLILHWFMDLAERREFCIFHPLLYLNEQVVCNSAKERLPFLVPGVGTPPPPKDRIT